MITLAFMLLRLCCSCCMYADPPDNIQEVHIYAVFDLHVCMVTLEHSNESEICSYIGLISSAPPV